VTAESKKRGRPPKPGGAIPASERQRAYLQRQRDAAAARAVEMMVATEIDYSGYGRKLDASAYFSFREDGTRFVRLVTHDPLRVWQLERGQARNLAAQLLEAADDCDFLDKAKEAAE